MLTSTGDLANINPLRYRGYYYDTEAGLYYLQSRYYDPELGRFINADTYATTDVVGILSANMYAYCENDPVNNSDPTGQISHILIGAAVGGIVSAVCEAVAGGDAKSIARAFVVGAVEGAVCAAAPALASVFSPQIAEAVGVGIRVAIGAYEATKTVIECREAGVGWGKSALAGAVVFVSSFAYVETGDLLTNTVFDLTFGMGASLTSRIITEGIIRDNGHTERKKHIGPKKLGYVHVQGKGNKHHHGMSSRNFVTALK